MLNLQLPESKRLDILCLGAHCDDIEIGCGGTLLKLFDRYTIGTVRWVVFTSNPERKNEAINCANRFLQNVENNQVEVHEFRDGFMPFVAAEVKETFESIKRDFNPDLIFTHYRDDLHQDHRLVNQLTWNTWRSHMILEYEIPKYDGDLGIPNCFVELDDEHLNKKVDFLLAEFESQRGKHWFDRETFAALPRIRGMESASRYAEAFHLRKIAL